MSIPQHGVDSVMSTDSQPPEDEQKTLPAVPRKKRIFRHWSNEMKRRIVEETLLPGASVSIVARRHDVNANLVFGWRQLYEQGRLGESGSGQRFIQVGMMGNQASLPVPASGSRTAGPIELELPSGVRLRVDSRIEEAVLRRVLRAVKSSA